MFTFFRARRARSIVEQVGLGLAESMSALSPAERSATLAIANAMLVAGSRKWGRAVLDSPKSLSEKEAMEIIFELAAMQSQVVNGYLAPMRHRGMGDITFAQGMRQTRAAELVIASVGMALVPDAEHRARPAWKVLWNARSEAEHGVSLLLQYASHSKSSPFPRIPGVKMDKAKAMQYATSVPPFLRPRTANGKQASVARTAVAGRN